MNKLRIISILIILPLMALACASLPVVTLNGIRGSGKVTSENRDVKDFQSVSLGGSGDLIITQGDSEALKIEAEGNILPMIESDVRGGTLYLGFKPNTGSISPTQPIKFYLSVKNLNGIDLSGSGSVQADALKANNITFTCSGSGSITVKTLTADALNYNLSGSGSTSLGGIVGVQSVEISGSGSYQAADLDSQQATAILTGSGDMTIWAKDSLNITISGSGSVNYYGKPILSQSITGSGKITSLGDK
jgi:hypothetical protein